jgi:hypothetical protein
MKPKLLYLKKPFQECVIKWQQGEYQKYHNTYKIYGFNQYNLLLEFNWFVEPNDYDPIVDRTQTVSMPFAYHIDRPWQPPAHNISLKEFFRCRTQQYLLTGQKINIFWSGGIDSTAIVVGFLTNCATATQLRIIYTNASVNENPEFFSLLKKFSVELYELTLTGALHDKLDGITVNGMTLDERSAGISQTAFSLAGGECLFLPWQDYFRNCSVSSTFFDFFEQWFAVSSRPIKTLLDARWWFYLQTKSQSQKYAAPRFYTQMFESQKINCCFYDCEEYDSYIYHNVDAIIQPGNTYHQHKNFLKQYIRDFDNNHHYYNFAIKINSNTMFEISKHVDILKDQCWAFLLEDLSYHGTANLPLLSVIELEQHFGNKLDYLFNFGRSC